MYHGPIRVGESPNPELDRVVPLGLDSLGRLGGAGRGESGVGDEI